MTSLWMASSAALAVANTPNTSDPAESDAVTRTVMKPLPACEYEVRQSRTARWHYAGGLGSAGDALGFLQPPVSRQFDHTDRDIAEVPPNQVLPAARSRHGATSSLLQQ
jgi:hypothetical protein